MLRKGNNEFILKEDGKDIGYNKKSEAEDYKLCIEGYQRLAGYEVSVKEC